MANHQSNYGMARESCRAVGICGSSGGKKNGGSLFAAAIGLAFHIDDSYDWPLDRVLTLLDHFANARSESGSLFQSPFPLPGTRKHRERLVHNPKDSYLV